MRAWIGRDVAQDTNQRQALLNTAGRIQMLYEAGNFLHSRSIITFLKRTLIIGLLRNVIMVCSVSLQVTFEV
jgi:hypothetical protein